METTTDSTTPPAVRTILVYDSETTGIPAWKLPSEHPDQPHIVELAASLVNKETREVVKHFNVIIKPDGWVIPEETTAIHGITNERALESGVPEQEALAMLLALLEEGEQLGQVELVGHNESFDRRIVRIAIKRYLDLQVPEDQPTPSDKWKAQTAFCTCWLSRPHTKLPKNKLPKLTEAYLHFMGVPMAGAHSARGDVDGCMAVFFAIQDLLNPPAAVVPELQAA